MKYILKPLKYAESLMVHFIVRRILICKNRGYRKIVK